MPNGDLNGCKLTGDISCDVELSLSISVGAGLRHSGHKEHFGLELSPQGASGKQSGKEPSVSKLDNTDHHTFYPEAQLTGRCMGCHDHRLTHADFASRGR